MEDDSQLTPPPPQPHQLHLSKHLTTIHNYPRIKRRKSQGSRTKLTQIREKPAEPESDTQLVSYDKSGESGRKRRGGVIEFSDNADAKSFVMELAEEIRANLEAQFPSFAKALVRSNVTVGFWMHLPMRFCKTHLPKNDTMVFLENESGQEFIINYIADRTALSGGWKAFCAGNNLHEGDVLIFHLVKPLRFKVYIVRGNSSAKVDGESDAVDLNACKEKEYQAEKDTESNKEDGLLGLVTVVVSQEKNQEKCLMVLDKDAESNKENEHMGLITVVVSPENKQENALMVLDNDKGHIANESGNDSKSLGSEAMELSSSGSSLDFKNVKGIEEFSILVNGSAIDSEVSDLLRTKYYELCCSQNSFLHDNLLKSINYKLAAEIIIGTVNISEAVRASKLSSSSADYAVWDKTLKGFELLGMNVGFLRSRLSRLMSLAMESEEAAESECRELRLEQARINDEMESLELKLLKLKEASEKLDAEIEALKENAERHELMFLEVVTAPW